MTIPGDNAARTAQLAELRSYVGLTDHDAALLAALLPDASPRFGALADEFYAVIRMHAGAFAVLKDEAQAQRLHASLQGWLGELLSGRYDEAYVERHARIGQAHVRVGLEPRYVVTAMSRVRAGLQRIAAEVARDRAAAEQTQLAVARVCDLDLAIMLESYKLDLVGQLERVRASERDSIRSQLDDRKRLLEDVQQAADVVLIGLDARGRVVVANPKAEKLAGYSREELGALDLFKVLFGEQAGAVRASLMASTRGEAVELEVEARTRTGRSRTIRWHASAYQAADADAPTVVLVGIDVTKERELERQARQNERLATAGALAAGLAHEIRNPLNGASLHLSVIERGLARSSTEVSPPMREATEVLRAELFRLGRLVSDFLDVSRPRPLVLAACDLNALATDVRTLLGPEAQTRGISVAVRAFPFPVMALVDVERTKQVLVNLVRNAIDAASDGGKVELAVRRMPDHVEIDVSDDGPGMADPSAPIFDAFFTTKDRGTGLGLSIVQRIVADHGGDVSFSSRPGATVFTVKLPARTML